MQDAGMQRIAAIFVGIILVLFVFIVGTAVIYYPGMIRAGEQIDQHWAALNKLQQQRMATLEQVQKIAPTPPEPALLAKVVETGKALTSNPINTEHAPPFAGQLLEYRKLYQAHQQQLLAWMVALEEKQDAWPAQPELRQKIEQEILQQNLERSRYNQAVQIFNQKANAFPVSLISGRLGFGSRPEL